MPRPSTARFAAALIPWHERHGRQDLPWQRDRSPYRVWVSEIMLQQTQVATVVPYYERFLRRFPDIATLAAAPLDEVLHLWSGLGYYARARNLHRAARAVCDAHGGRFPHAFAEVASLPGIGRSTAGAILALSRSERFPILDGNVRRVLARHFGIEGSLSDRATVERLWSLAEACTPAECVAVYTQAIMDLGATLCTRRNPRCDTCPVGGSCVARRTGRQHELPRPRRARARRLREVFMLAALGSNGSVLLERRRERGIWGGLWCLPEFETAEQAAEFAARALPGLTARPLPLAPIAHAFTHFDLVIRPLLAHCSGGGGAPDPARHLWYRLHAPARLGLPAPVRALLEQLRAPCAVQAQLID